VVTARLCLRHCHPIWNGPRLVSALSDADRLIGKLAGEGGRLPNPHILMRPFVKREAVLSSRIEGTPDEVENCLAECEKFLHGSNLPPLVC